LTRKNTFTGIEYRNDPTIFGWELINEPRCMTDRSGDTLQVSPLLAHSNPYIYRTRRLASNNLKNYYVMLPPYYML